MNECNNCKKDYLLESLIVCPNCGASICGECALNGNYICPFCYSDLINGEKY